MIGILGEHRGIRASQSPPRQEEGASGSRKCGGKAGSVRKAARASGHSRRKRSSRLRAAVTEAEVTTAWKRAATEHHPGRSGD